MTTALCLYTLFACCAVEGQTDPRYREISDQQYQQLSTWLFKGARAVTGKWAAYNNTWWSNLCGYLHTGVDYSATAVPPVSVYAATSGEVIRAAPGCAQQVDNCLSTIAIYNDATDTTFFYLHMESFAVSNGQQVSAGTFLGTAGARGRASGTHLHFEARSGRIEYASTCIDRTVNPYRAAARARTVTGPSSSCTVLVMDVSGSMAWQWQGEQKIAAARRAALQFIEEVSAAEPGNHMIGVVTFSNSAGTPCALTHDYQRARNTIISLGTVSATNLGAGLVTALQELDKGGTGQRTIILLSDGMTNTGLSRSQILSGPVAEARRKGICIHTVAFGDKGDVDEEFLQRIARESGCGTYNYAATGFDLFGTYIRVRHSMLGSNRIVDFSSGGAPVTLLSGQSAALGAFQLTAPAQELHYTLAWSQSGLMRAILVDPSGRQVVAGYPGATLYSGSGFSHITVRSPQPGAWRASAAAVTSFPRGVQYYGVASARTGGFVIPLPAPGPACITLLGRRICIAMPDMPTTIIMAVALVALAVLLLDRFSAL